MSAATHPPPIAWRTAGADALSLALIDARNHTLAWLAHFEAVLGADRMRAAPAPGVDAPLWSAGHAGWIQERWIARNAQRARGPACDAALPPLPSVVPLADTWFETPGAAMPHRLPDAQVVRDYLAVTIETTLELLARAGEGDAALHFYRLALHAEDALCESLAVALQASGATLGAAAALLASRATPMPRAPLTFTAGPWTLGSTASGFAFDNERPGRRTELLAYEIDAQAVSWSQYAEFVADGGYDDPRWWHRDGWAWVQRGARRVPRDVSQIRQAVILRQFATELRVPLAQPVVHVSWYEADAWCRWAGRRLPAEAEWERAACQGVARGFRWGDVWEWTANTHRPYPGAREAVAAVGSQGRVLRGASFATRQRQHHARFRRVLAPERDEAFTGFRSCAA